MLRRSGDTTDVIREVQGQEPEETTIRELADFYKVFGDATRVRILCVLLRAEMCVCDLAELLGMTQSAISHQLRILKQMKLVKNRREARPSSIRWRTIISRRSSARAWNISVIERRRTRGRIRWRRKSRYRREYWLLLRRSISPRSFYQGRSCWGMSAVLPFSCRVLVAAFESLRAIRTGLMNRKLEKEHLLMVIATVGALAVGHYAEAVAAMLLFQIGCILEAVSVDRTKRTIAKFIDIRPACATRKEESGEVQVEPSQLEVGDIIVIKPGERVPVDAVIVSGNTSLDTKALTGEAMPDSVGPGSRIYSGSINMTGVVEAEVKKLYRDSTVSRVMELVEGAQNQKAQSEGFVRRFTRIYTPVAVLAALIIRSFPAPVHNGERLGYLDLPRHDRPHCCLPDGPHPFRAHRVPRRYRLGGPAGDRGKGRQLSGNAGKGGYLCV